MYQGVVVLNKEPGFTSFDAVAVCRGIFGQKAVGHTGTLDPMARGVLPICLGRATKLSDLLTSSEKEYEVEMELGHTTDTDDTTGQVIAEAAPEVLEQLTEVRIREALMHYLGDFLQVPPRFAAIKKDGKKLYEYARAGIEVEMPGRPVSIYELDILEMDLCGIERRYPLIRFRVRCSKGTYIRSLCRDVGKDLGVGGLMASLLRRQTGGFTLEESVTLETLKQAKAEGSLERYIRPVDQLLRHLPALECLEEGRKLLQNGNPLSHKLLSAKDPTTESMELQEDTLYRVYLDGELAALYRYDASAGKLRNEKMLITDYYKGSKD